MQEENNKYNSFDSNKRTRNRTKTTNALIESHKFEFNKSLNKNNDDLVLSVVEENPPPFKNVGRIVQTQQKRTENVINRAVTDLKSQESSLEERLANRKQKVLNMSTDSANNSFCIRKKAFCPVEAPMSPTNNSFFFDFESDRSAGENFESQVSLKIEKIMEENFSEKSEKITEIKVKYETEINDLPSDSGIYTEIIKEMRKQMKKEIEEISLALDNKRKELILKAKNESGLY